MKRKTWFCLGLVMVLFFQRTMSQEYKLDNLLKLDIESLLDVNVVSASKILQKISEVPATVHVISSETIKDNGYLTLEDVLADLPGFQFRNINGFNSYIFQRGIPNQNNLILLLLDGIQINELNSGGFYGGGQFNLENVERIEVVYGPASTLYGTNAVSGVINIITKDIEENQGFEASALYGSFNTINGNMSYSKYNDDNQFGMRISTMYKKSEKANLGGADGDWNWTDNMENFEDDYALDFKLKYKKFTFGTNYQLKKSSRTTNYKTTGTNYLDRNSSWNIMFLNTYFTYTHNFSDKVNTQFKAYYRNATVLDNTIGYVLDTEQVGYYRPNSLAGAEGIISFTPIEKLSFIGGVVIENEQLAVGFTKSFSSSSTKKPLPPTKPDVLGNSLLSIFMQGQYYIFNSLSFVTGLRFDNSSVYDQVLTPRLSLIYHKNKFTSKLLYAEAFRAPKPWDYTSGVGNSDLLPEEIQSTELVTTYSIVENLRINMSFYRNNLNKLISKETVDQSYRWVNTGRLTTRGFEISLDYKNKGVSTYANYTFCSSEDDSKEMIPEIARHSANIGLTYNINDHFKINTRGNYLGKRRNPKTISATGTDIIDPAFILHATISYLDFHRLDFQLILRNLLNTEYYHPSNRPPDRYRQPQRSIMIKCSYHI